MDELKINDRILDVVGDLDLGIRTFDEDLKGSAGLDSLDMVELSIGIEREFNIIIPDAELVNFKTLNDFKQFVMDYKSIHINGKHI